MIPHRLTSFTKFVGFSLIFLCVIKVISYLPYKIGINWTNSMHQGIYIINLSPQNVYFKDQLVVVCIPDKKLAAMALERHYLSKGACPYGNAYELKRVVAVPGDSFKNQLNYLIINGLFRSNFHILNKDSNGNPIFSLLPTTGILKSSQYLVLGNSYNSLDSRYYGIVDTKFIMGRAYPFITW